MRGPPQIFQSSESINGARQISKSSIIPKFTNQQKKKNTAFFLIFFN